MRKHHSPQFKTKIVLMLLAVNRISIYYKSAELDEKKNFREEEVMLEIDINYIKYNRSHFYLMVIIDWFSHKITGWALTDTLGISAAIQIVRDAVGKHSIPAIINLDQGLQFTSKNTENF